MFSVYGIRIINGKKDRHHIGKYEDRHHAISICRLLDCDYGYVKEFGSSTIYYLPIKPGYYEHRGPPLIMKPIPPGILG
ncbi:hypothetical protein K3217_13060 [bacterium BD-1]|nr:hypothetical protein [Ottowia caeni]